jgi:hypothetical protein
MLAADRPFVPVAVGYLLVAALLAAVVTVQSGPAAGVASGLANLVVLAPAAGISWALGRLFARRAPPGQAWWMTRAQGYVAAFIATVTAALFPMGYVAEEIRKTPQAAAVPMAELAAALVGGLAFVNALPLVLALGLEAWGRRGARGPTGP